MIKINKRFRSDSIKFVTISLTLILILLILNDLVKSLLIKILNVGKIKFLLILEI